MYLLEEPKRRKRIAALCCEALKLAERGDFPDQSEKPQIGKRRIT